MADPLPDSLEEALALLQEQGILVSLALILSRKWTCILSRNHEEYGVCWDGESPLAAVRSAYEDFQIIPTPRVIRPRPVHVPSIPITADDLA